MGDGWTTRCLGKTHAACIRSGAADGGEVRRTAWAEEGAELAQRGDADRLSGVDGGDEIREGELISLGGLDLLDAELVAKIGREGETVVFRQTREGLCTHRWRGG